MGIGGGPMIYLVLVHLDAHQFLRVLLSRHEKNSGNFRNDNAMVALTVIVNVTSGGGGCVGARTQRMRL